jgi:hypothetical protein
MARMEQIYLLKTDMTIDNLPIYKIGRSRQPDVKRIRSYPKTYQLVSMNTCENCVYIEAELLKLFHSKYKIAYRHEYFVGDENEMARDIRTMIDEYIPNEIKPLFFECKLCAFKTHVKAGYDDHLTTQEHSMKVKEADEKYKQRKQLKQNIHGIVLKSKDMERKIISTQNKIDVLMKKYIKK